MIIKPPGKEEIPQLRTLWKQAFGDTDAFLDIFFSTAFAFDRCRCVVEDGVVAAALYWFSCQADGQPLAYLYAVATAEEFRGQGLCRQLMADTHSHLENLGYAGAMLVPGDPELRKMYRAMGYEDMTSVERFSCQAGAPICLERIDGAAYAALRRERLPQNAVLQEGENLRFLEAISQFYRGEDVLLCAAKDGDRLIVPDAGRCRGCTWDRSGAWVQGRHIHDARGGRTLCDGHSHWAGFSETDLFCLCV